MATDVGVERSGRYRPPLSSPPTQSPEADALCRKIREEYLPRVEKKARQRVIALYAIIARIRTSPLAVFNAAERQGLTVAEVAGVEKDNFERYEALAEEIASDEKCDLDRFSIRVAGPSSVPFFHTEPKSARTFLRTLAENLHQTNGFKLLRLASAVGIFEERVNPEQNRALEPESMISILKQVAN